jgi:hypothetical protein
MTSTASPKILIVGVGNVLHGDDGFGVQLAWRSESSLSDLVLSEIEVGRVSGQRAVIGERPLTPDNDRIVDGIVEFCQRAALDSADALQEFASLTSDQVTPVATVCHNEFMDESSYPGKLNFGEQAK